MSIVTEGLADAIPLIQKFSPIIFSVLTGNLGIGSTTALSILGSAFGVHPGNLTILGHTILSDPDFQSKLEALEKTHGSYLPFVDNLNKLRNMEIKINLTWDGAPQKDVG
jgi:hypothetical protein